MSATVLRTATLALVHFTAEYCGPVSYRSVHTCFIDKVIIDALRIMTGCLRPTLTDNFFVLARIQPIQLRRQTAILSLAFHPQEPEHLLHKRLVFLSCGYLRQLKSRHPCVLAALELLNDFTQSGTGVAQWADYK